MSLPSPVNVFKGGKCCAAAACVWAAKASVWALISCARTIDSEGPTSLAWEDSVTVSALVILPSVSRLSVTKGSSCITEGSMALGSLLGLLIHLLLQCPWQLTMQMHLTMQIHLTMQMHLTNLKLQLLYGGFHNCYFLFKRLCQSLHSLSLQINLRLFTSQCFKPVYCS